MRLIKLLVCIVFCASLSVIAFAHSGGTDSSGGHTDKSTGEYHYHHGYPAHKHTDLNGDGILDCPYEFDDKSGSSGTGGTSTSTNPTKPSTKPTEEKIVSKETSKEKTFEDYLGIFYFAFLVLLILNPLISAIKKRFKK